jgi:serine O-acetyltransferase
MSKTKLPQIIGEIVDTYDSKDGINHIEGPNLPSRDRVVEITVSFLDILFPGYYEKQELSQESVTYYIWEKIAFIYHHLSRYQRYGKNCVAMFVLLTRGILPPRVWTK